MSAPFWTKSLVNTVIFFMVWSALSVGAQTQAGSLSGKLTDLHSRPLEGATVIVRNLATGSEARTITGDTGAYRFASLGPGEYTLEAQSPALGQGHLEGILVVAGHEARVQAAIELAPVTLSAENPLHQPTPTIPSTSSGVSPGPSHAGRSSAPTILSETIPAAPIRWIPSPIKSESAVPPEILHGTLSDPPFAAITPHRDLAMLALPAKPFAGLGSASLNVPIQHASALPSASFADVVAFTLRAAIRVAKLDAPDSTPPVPELESAQSTATIESAELDSLPLANRNWVFMAHDAPGVTEFVGRGSGNGDFVVRFLPWPGVRPPPATARAAC